MTAIGIMAIGLSVTSVSLAGAVCFIIHRYTGKEEASNKGSFPMLVPLSGGLGDALGGCPGSCDAPKDSVKDTPHGNYR